MDLLQQVGPRFEQISEQVTKQLTIWIGNDKPIVVKFVKIIGTGSFLFIATQILRKIWYTSYNKYNKYPPGTNQLYFQLRMQ